MAFPRSGLLLVGLPHCIYPGRGSGNDKQSLKQDRHIPRMRGNPYATAAVVGRDVGVYWITRFRMMRV
jgi:hypothetical protein